MSDTSLTSTAHLVAERLARYGNPDGSSIFLSEQRLADDLELALGTVSRAVCELEDAGWLRVKRWRPVRDRHTFDPEGVAAWLNGARASEPRSA